MTVAATSVELTVEAPPAPPGEILFGPPYPRRRENARVTAGNRPRAAGPHPRHTQLEARARRLVQALVEIVDGDRPVTQLLRMATRSVYDDLVARLASLGAATSAAPGSARCRRASRRCTSVSHDATARRSRPGSSRATAHVPSRCASS